MASEESVWTKALLEPAVIDYERNKGSCSIGTVIME